LVRKRRKAIVQTTGGRETQGREIWANIRKRHLASSKVDEKTVLREWREKKKHTNEARQGGSALGNSW